MPVTDAGDEAQHYQKEGEEYSVFTRLCTWMVRVFSVTLDLGMRSSAVQADYNLLSGVIKARIEVFQEDCAEPVLVQFVRY